MDSIIQKENCCFVCGETKNLHTHHIFFGTAKRQLSEKYGLTIRLCVWHHTSSMGIHCNKEMDDDIKAMAQTKAMNYYNWSLEDWMKIFRRNYL